MKLIKGKNLILLLPAVAGLVIAVIALEYSALQHTDGIISYPSDKAFVDITVARNLAFYQVWGVSKFAFQSAATSLLYPIVLAPVFFIFGQHLVIPIVVNGLAALFFLVILQKALIRRGIPSVLQVGILLFVVFMAPLPLLIVSGMSYTLQLLFSFLFLESLAISLEKGQKRLPASIYFFGVLVMAARYEDLVVLVLAALLLLALRRRAEALKLLLISLSPVVLFGILSLTKGSHFLPNSLFLGSGPGFAVYLLFVSMAIGAALIWKYRRAARENREVSAYRLSFALMTLIALPFLLRNFTALRHFQEDSVRIYQQEYPLAAFVRRYYRRLTIGVNDIGAIAWFSDGKKLDFTGLASADVVQIKRDHSWSAGWADSLSRRNAVRTIMVSDPWFRAQSFPRWGMVATWKLPDSPSSPGRTFCFYVTERRDTAMLRRHLHEYQNMLSRDVEVRYY
jgi:hypothetical protein